MATCFGALVVDSVDIEISAPLLYILRSR
jgi:hypothetical protein